ncbi:hypothetical protein ABPG74_000820 [Tetrahymena malaccensis]
MDMQTSDNLMSVKCIVHKNKPLIAISLDEQRGHLRVLCSKCIRQYNFEYKDIIFIDDVIDSDQNTIFENLPIQTQNQNLMKEIQLYIEDIDEDASLQSPQLIIQLFYEEFIKRMNEGLNKSMKKILTNIDNIFITKEKLQEVYNSLIQKQKLQEYVSSLKKQDPESLQNLNNLIQKMQQNKETNNTLLVDTFNQLQQTQEKLQLKMVNYYMEQALKQIEHIEEYFYDNNKICLNKVLYNDQEPLNLKNQTVEQITKLINNKTNYCNERFINDINNFLNQISSGLSRISIDQIYTQNKFPLEFNDLLQQQFELIEEQINCLLKINNNLKIAKCPIDFQSIDQIQDQLSNKQNDLLKFNKNLIHEAQINIFGQIDKTFSCSFLKSKQDCYSLTNQIIKRDSTNRIEIKSIKPGWQVQSYLEENIDPFKKYLLRLQFEPFQTHQENYRFYIGIIEDRFCDTKWLDSSAYLFSNNPISVFSFNKVKKGLNINHSDIRYDQNMRFLEFQMCLADKHFLIMDYPQFQNITVAEIEKFNRFPLEESYRLIIESESVQKIRIHHFSEVKQFI